MNLKFEMESNDGRLNRAYLRWMLTHIKKPPPGFIAKYGRKAAEDRLARYLQKLVEAAPTLSPSQVSGIRVLRSLRGSQGVSTGSTNVPR